MHMATLGLRSSSLANARFHPFSFLDVPSRGSAVRLINLSSCAPRLVADPCDSRHSINICRASGQGSASNPDEDSGKDRHTGAGSPCNIDWRTFRARLVASEQIVSKTKSKKEPSVEDKSISVSMLGDSWAHPLHGPETGCLLVATDKLDGQIPFERTVILLLQLGSRKPVDGPFGIILNRPIVHAMNEFKGTSQEIADAIRNCQLFYGGPLESNMFLLMDETGGKDGLEEIIPGLYYGYADELQPFDNEAFHPQDYRYYVGYSGWDFDQLMAEVEAGLWHVAACSPNLIKRTSCDRLWQEVLLLMGGSYAELSQKPKEDF